jgi:hypothetical protein
MLAFVPFAVMGINSGLFEEPYDVTIAGAISALTDLGLFPVIAVAAVLTLAVLVYRRFRK